MKSEQAYSILACVIRLNGRFRSFPAAQLRFNVIIYTLSGSQLLTCVRRAAWKWNSGAMEADGSPSRGVLFRVSRAATLRVTRFGR
eukprot:4868988-Pleurochrysis_carterae.AAC.1